MTTGVAFLILIKIFKFCAIYRKIASLHFQRSHYRRLQDTEHMQLKKTVLFKKIPGSGKNLRIFWNYIQNQKLTAGKHSKSEKSSDLLYNFFEILMVGLRPTGTLEHVKPFEVNRVKIENE